MRRREVSTLIRSLSISPAYEGRGEPSVFNVDFLPENTAGQPAFWLHNVRLAYRVPEGNIEIAGWCRNVTDKVYKAYAFDASTFSGVGGTTGKPSE